MSQRLLGGGGASKMPRPMDAREGQAPLLRVARMKLRDNLEFEIFNKQKTGCTLRCSLFVMSGIDYLVTASSLQPASNSMVPA